MTKRVKYTSKPPWLSKDIEEAMHQRHKLLKANKHEELKKAEEQNDIFTKCFQKHIL